MPSIVRPSTGLSWTDQFPDDPSQFSMGLAQLFTDLLLLLPKLESHVVWSRRKGSDEGLTIAAKSKKGRQRDRKGKGKLAEEGSMLTQHDMESLYDLLYNLASAYGKKKITSTSPSETYDIPISLMNGSGSQYSPAVPQIVTACPLSSKSPSSSTSAYRAGVALAGNLKVPLEALLDTNCQFRAKHVQDGTPGDSQMEISVDLVLCSLVLCLYITYRVSPGPLLKIQLQELYPTYDRRVDYLLEPLLFSPSNRSNHDPGPSSPASPASNRGQDNKSYSTSPVLRKALIPSRPSSIFSNVTRTSLAPSFISFNGSIRSVRFGAEGLRTKSTASLPTLHLEGSMHVKSSRRHASHAEGFGMSMIDLPSAAQSTMDRNNGAASVVGETAEDRLRRYQRNTSSKLSQNRASTSGSAGVNQRVRAGSERSWFSSLGFGRRGHNIRSPLSREGSSEPPDHEEASRLLPAEGDCGLSSPSDKPSLVNKKDNTKIAVDSSTSSRRKTTTTSKLRNQTDSTVDPSTTGPSTPGDDPVKRASRAFEDAADGNIAPISAKLLAAEMSSAMTQKAVCSVCRTQGTNFPSCRKCGDTFCSRVCRVGKGAGGDGTRHICGIYETRLLSRAAQSVNGELLPSPPTLKPVNRETPLAMKNTS